MNGVPLPFSSARVRIHDLAAILLIVGLAIAVFFHAFPKLVEQLESRPATRADMEFRWWYLLILSLMGLGVIVAGLAAWRNWTDHVVILLEWWELVLFCVFWFLQTRRIGKMLKERETAAEAEIVTT
jgi:hypothetical protein